MYGEVQRGLFNRESPGTRWECRLTDVHRWRAVDSSVVPRRAGERVADVVATVTPPFAAAHNGLQLEDAVVLAVAAAGLHLAELFSIPYTRVSCKFCLLMVISGVICLYAKPAASCPAWQAPALPVFVSQLAMAVTNSAEPRRAKPDVTEILLLLSAVTVCICHDEASVSRKELKCYCNSVATWVGSAALNITNLLQNNRVRES